MPTRKKKCPTCGEFMYVRTRPSDRKKVVVTKNQANAIEEQWAHYHQDQAMARLTSHPDYSAAARRLRRTLGREPTADESKLEISLREAARHRRKHDWGLYRNSVLDAATALQTLGRADESLRKHLEVCYLDVNGPQNCGGIPENLGDEYAPFDPNTPAAVPARGVLLAAIDLGCKLCQDPLEPDLGCDMDKLRDMFLSVAAETQRDLRLPVTPEVAWGNINAELARTCDT
ncbi:MAG TPA: hypothetical protein VMH22_15725 [bacterium]|nr:hypothetical protein [bacterium]